MEHLSGHSSSLEYNNSSNLSAKKPKPLPKRPVASSNKGDEIQGKSPQDLTNQKLNKINQDIVGIINNVKTIIEDIEGGQTTKKLLINDGKLEHIKHIVKNEIQNEKGQNTKNNKILTYLDSRLNVINKVSDIINQHIDSIENSSDQIKPSSEKTSPPSPPDRSTRPPLSTNTSKEGPHVPSISNRPQLSSNTTNIAAFLASDTSTQPPPLSKVDQLTKELKLASNVIGTLITGDNMSLYLKDGLPAAGDNSKLSPSELATHEAAVKHIINNFSEGVSEGLNEFATGGGATQNLRDLILRFNKLSSNSIQKNPSLDEGMSKLLFGENHRLKKDINDSILKLDFSKNLSNQDVSKICSLFEFAMNEGLHKTVDSKGEQNLLNVIQRFLNKKEVKTYLRKNPEMGKRLQELQVNEILNDIFDKLDYGKFIDGMNRNNGEFDYALNRIATSKMSKDKNLSEDKAYEMRAAGGSAVLDARRIYQNFLPKIIAKLDLARIIINDPLFISTKGLAVFKELKVDQADKSKNKMEAQVIKGTKKEQKNYNMESIAQPLMDIIIKPLGQTRNETIEPILKDTAENFLEILTNDKIIDPSQSKVFQQKIDDAFRKGNPADLDKLHLVMTEMCIYDKLSTLSSPKFRTPPSFQKKQQIMDDIKKEKESIMKDLISASNDGYKLEKINKQLDELIKTNR